MSTNVIPFDAGNSALPAHLRKFVADNNDLSAGAVGGYRALSYKGKTWAISGGGERTLITVDGKPDSEPLLSLELVLVKSNPALAKVFYLAGFEEGTDAKPDCYSNNGIEPEADSQQPQAKKCAICPNNQWGSKISDTQSKGKACSDSRRLAVIPNGDITEEPMLLRCPAASLKELTAYANALSKRNVPYQAVVTKVSFDFSVAYPKLTFKPVGYIDAATADRVAELVDSDIVAQIVGLKPSAAAALAAPVEDDLDALGAPPAHLQAAEEPAAKPARKPAKPKVEADPAVVEAAADLARKAAMQEALDTAKVNADAAAKAKRIAAAKAALAELEADEEPAAPTATVTTAAEPVTIVNAETGGDGMDGLNAELDSLLSGFDD